MYVRREPWFEKCAGYEFGNYAMVEHGLEGNVERFFGHVSGSEPNGRFVMARGCHQSTPCYDESAT